MSTDADFHSIEAVVMLALITPFWTQRDRARFEIIAEVLEHTTEHRLPAELWWKFLHRLHPEVYGSSKPRSFPAKKKASARKVA